MRGQLLPVLSSLSSATWAPEQQREGLEIQGSLKSFLPYKIQSVLRAGGDVKYSCSSIKDIKASLNWN